MPDLICVPQLPQYLCAEFSDILSLPSALLDHTVQSCIGTTPNINICRF